MKRRKPKPLTRIDRAVEMLLLTFIVWLFAGLTVVANFGGDCFPELAVRCPTDHERSMSVVWTVIVACVINAAGLVLLAWAHARRNSKR